MQQCPRTAAARIAVSINRANASPPASTASGAVTVGPSEHSVSNVIDASHSIENVVPCGVCATRHQQFARFPTDHYHAFNT